MNLAACVPKDKHDLAALDNARTLGFPGLDPALPDLLKWMQDINWPVASPVADLLSETGPPIVPHLRHVFLSEDSVWKYWILQQLAPRLRPSVLIMLDSDIAQLATSPTDGDRAEEVDRIAKELSALIRKL